METEPGRVERPLRGLLLATLTSVLWGTVPVAGKVALGGMSAPLLSVLRLVAAGLLLVLLLGRTRFRSLGTPSRLVYLAALGLGANYVFYMWGLEHAGAGTSQVLIQTAPLFLILLGILALGERPSAWEWGGMAGAGLGVFLVSCEEIAGVSGSALGIGLVLASALAWAIYAVAHKRLGRDHASGGTMCWIFLLSVLVVAPTVPFAPVRTADPVQVAAIAYLCLNTLVAYWCFAEALRHIRATTAAVIATLGPAITFGLLAVTNRMDQPYVPYEEITAVKIAGSVLVVAGVVLAITKSRR
jgi:drug/metabolite transporter (DMT)-like permease